MVKVHCVNYGALCKVFKYVMFNVEIVGPSIYAINNTATSKDNFLDKRAALGGRFLHILLCVSVISV